MKKLLRIARATSMFVGAVVILAVVLGIGSTALAANGKPFILGVNNAATAITTLTKQGVGPALNLVVRPGQPPIRVNSPVKVVKLNSDTVDGKHSTDFLASNGKAADAARADIADTAESADTLDGKDSSDFASSSAEAWRVVDADYGGSGFHVASTGQCGNLGRPNWMDIARFGNDWARAAYFKDQAGVVHIKGQLRDNSSCYPEYNAPNDDATIFVLPPEYRPSERQSFATTSNHAFGEVFIRPDGSVVALRGSLQDFSLNGISFRAAN